MLRLMGGLESPKKDRELELLAKCHEIPIVSSVGLLFIENIAATDSLYYK